MTAPPAVGLVLYVSFAHFCGAVLLWARPQGRPVVQALAGTLGSVAAAAKALRSSPRALHPIPNQELHRPLLSF